MDEKFTISQAARFLRVSYHRIVYAIAKGWLEPERTKHSGPLFTKEQLIAYARARGIDV